MKFKELLEARYVADAVEMNFEDFINFHKFVIIEEVDQIAFELNIHNNEIMEILKNSDFAREEFEKYKQRLKVKTHRNMSTEDFNIDFCGKLADIVVIEYLFKHSNKNKTFNVDTMYMPFDFVKKNPSMILYRSNNTEENIEEIIKNNKWLLGEKKMMEILKSFPNLARKYKPLIDLEWKKKI